MDWQNIGVSILLILSIAYLVRYFYLQTKSHNCDDCGLMDLKKQGQLTKLKSTHKKSPSA